MKGEAYRLLLPRTGGSSGAVLNAANEVAVDAFLNNRISFPQITDFAEKMLNKYEIIQNASLDELLTIDKRIRAEAI